MGLEPYATAEALKPSMAIRRRTPPVAKSRPDEVEVGEVRAPSIAPVERKRLDLLLARELALYSEGMTRIAGVDEAGVGPLAGPVVAAAVILPPGLGIAGVNDSKKLSFARRQTLAVEIRRCAIAWAVSRVEPEEIDRINIYQASLQAMRRAVLALEEQPDFILVDARRIPGVTVRQESIIGGDARCHAIAAASILAKTARDAIMAEYEDQFPGYGFAGHKGYPTDTHREAILRLGPCPIHRKSFRLLAQARLDGW